MSAGQTKQQVMGKNQRPEFAGGDAHTLKPPNLTASFGVISSKEELPQIDCEPVQGPVKNGSVAGGVGHKGYLRFGRQMRDALLETSATSLGLGGTHPALDTRATSSDSKP